MSTASLLPLDARGEKLAALLAVREIANETAKIDLGKELGTTELADTAVTLSALLRRALELLAGLQHGEGGDDEPMLELDAADTDAWIHADVAARTVPRLADVCFASTLELRRVLRELCATEADDERHAAVETAHRKLRRAVRAVLETARTTGIDVLGGQHQGQHQVSDLATGLAVRRLFAAFRRALRRPTEPTPDAVLVAVRYAGGALATIVASTDYGDIRASDRAILRGLRERALSWARGDRAMHGGLQLLEDVFTCGDLLRDVNRRQELRAHDASVIAACRLGPGDDVAGWRAQLEGLRGLDDGLDELIDRLGAEAVAGGARSGSVVIDAILRRLEGCADEG